MECRECGAAFGEEARRCGMCVEVMGDSYDNIYFKCPSCGLYWLDSYHDVFLGPETNKMIGPLSVAEGEAIEALIAQCPDPWRKSCRCSSHDALYYGRLFDKM